MKDLAYLDDEEASLLPARQTMLTIVLPVVDVATVTATNVGLALNAGTIASLAEAAAVQTISIGQL
jgi:hypothetical protein